MTITAAFELVRRQIADGFLVDPQWYAGVARARAARVNAVRDSWAERAIPVRRTGWERRAACQGVADLFVIEDVGAETSRSVDAAVAVCESCPVRLECLQQAMHEEQHATYSFGVRGGFSAAARRRLSRESDRRHRARHRAMPALFEVPAR